MKNSHKCIAQLAKILVILLHHTDRVYSRCNDEQLACFRKGRSFLNASTVLQATISPQSLPFCASSLLPPNRSAAERRAECIEIECQSAPASRWKGRITERLDLRYPVRLPPNWGASTLSLVPGIWTQTAVPATSVVAPFWIRTSGLGNRPGPERQCTGWAGSLGYFL